jgi:hypothetical protein
VFPGWLIYLGRQNKHRSSLARAHFVRFASELTTNIGKASELSPSETTSDHVSKFAQVSKPRYSKQKTTPTVLFSYNFQNLLPKCQTTSQP